MSVATAYWIAAVRARESGRPDRLFNDPYARALAGERGLQIMAASERATGAENAFIPVRVRWFDDAIMAAIAGGAEQVVLLGAGLDTRPYRLVLPSRVSWFELDRAEPLEAKQAILVDATPACERRALAVELTEDWVTALLADGFEPDRRTVWVAEGLFFYLDEPMIIALLRRATGVSGPGSRFLADVMGAAGLDGEAMRTYRQAREKAGVPPPYGCDDPAGLFRAGGWPHSELTMPGAPDANYGRFPSAGSFAPPTGGRRSDSRRSAGLRSDSRRSAGVPHFVQATDRPTAGSIVDDQPMS